MTTLQTAQAIVQSIKLDKYIFQIPHNYAGSHADTNLGTTIDILHRYDIRKMIVGPTHIYYWPKPDHFHNHDTANAVIIELADPTCFEQLLTAIVDTWP